MSDALRAQLLQERKAGSSYGEIGERHGIKPANVRYIVHTAVARGEATLAEVGGYKRREGSRPRMPDDQYNARWLDRLASKSYPGENGCIEVHAFHNHDGYVSMHHRDLGEHAHRIAVILRGRPIPPGFMACHRCGNHGCVNDDHLYVGTMKDNARDTVMMGRHRESQKTVCAHGHPFTPENTLWTGPRLNKRQCRECNRINQRRRWHEKKDYYRALQKKYRAKKRAAEVRT